VLLPLKNELSVLRAAASFNQRERDLWVQKIAQRVLPGQSVLDVGAGSAPYRNVFRHAVYKTHDFAQLRPDQLLGQQGYSAVDYVSDITAIPVPTASFDHILCTEVLEHIPDPLTAVAEMCRIVKPGGNIFLTAPLGSGLHQEPYHFYGGYTPFWYRYAFERVGAHVESIEPNGTFYRFFSQEMVRFVGRSRPAKIEGSLLAKVLWAPIWATLTCTLPAVLVFASRFRNSVRNADFTVGYHVVVKNGAAQAST
jgi:ubiquinone/menaquinone biosynthesis C-methylase UbiE